MKIQTRKIKLTDSKYNRKSPSEIKEIAKGILDNTIFTSQHLHEQERQYMSMVFMPLGMMNALQSRNMWRQNPWMFYAKRNRSEMAGPNGLPMLDNLAWLDKQDTLRVEKLIKIHDEALKKIDSIAV